MSTRASSASRADPALTSVPPLHPGIQQGLLAHRVDAVNSFVACNSDHSGHHPGHHTLMVVCARCGAVAALHDHDAMDLIAQRLRSGLPGFVETGIEIKGVCARCLGQDAVAPSAAAAESSPSAHHHSHADPGTAPR